MNSEWVATEIRKARKAERQENHRKLFPIRLVPFEAIGSGEIEPRDPDRFARDLAAAVNELLDDPARRARMGERARERVEHFFSWSSIARWTADFYWDLVQA